MMSMMAAGARQGGHAYVQGAQLGVWVLVADALLERAHSLFGRDGLGSDDIGDFEVESYVFTVSHRGMSEDYLGLTGRGLGLGLGLQLTDYCWWLARSAHPRQTPRPRTRTIPSSWAKE